MQKQGLIVTVFIHCKEIFGGFDGIRESYTSQNLCKYELTDMVVSSDKVVVAIQCCFTDGGAVVVTAVWPWDAADRDDYSWF